MDKELKEYLDKNMATKSDIDKLDKNIDGLDKKIEKGNKDLLGYIAHLDSELQEHRRNSEVHKKVPFANF